MTTCMRHPYNEKSCGAIEEGIDKRDLAQNARLYVLDVAAFDHESPRVYRRPST